MRSSAAPEATTYEPDPVQRERARALRRFNLFFVYLPAILLVLTVLVLVGLLLWGSLSPRIGGTREFASALADLIVIVIAMPLLLLCALGPGLAIAYIVYRRQQPKRPYGRAQVVLWRVDAVVLRLQERTGKLSGRLAKPVIAGHTRASYVGALWQQLRKMISRS